jgi:DNA polymerase III alpha subunit
VKIDGHGTISFNHTEIFDLIYSDKIQHLKEIYTDQNTVDQFNQSKRKNKDEFDELKEYRDPVVDIKTFDRNNQSSWFMPSEYKNLDIEQWVLQQCKTDEELARVKDEMVLFHQYKMIDVLRFLKYLVDTMRQRNIVWGIGRGSSVSSYVLFLIGIHKINSLLHNLNIDEFLK